MVQQMFQDNVVIWTLLCYKRDKALISSRGLAMPFKFSYSFEIENSEGFIFYISHHRHDNCNFIHQGQVEDNFPHATESPKGPSKQTVGLG